MKVCACGSIAFIVHGHGVDSRISLSVWSWRSTQALSALCYEAWSEAVECVRALAASLTAKHGVANRVGNAADPRTSGTSSRLSSLTSRSKDRSALPTKSPN